MYRYIRNKLKVGNNENGGGGSGMWQMFVSNSQVSDHGDRGLLEIWKSYSRLKIVFPFSLRIFQKTGCFLNRISVFAQNLPENWDVILTNLGTSWPNWKSLVTVYLTVNSDWYRQQTNNSAKLFGEKKLYLEDLMLWRRPWRCKRPQRGRRVSVYQSWSPFPCPGCCWTVIAIQTWTWDQFDKAF